MPGCSYVVGKDRKGKDVECGLVPQSASKYCPRHTSLHNIAEQKRIDKDVAVREAKRGGAGKGAGSGRSAGAAGVVPNTRAGLILRGYQFTGNNECSGCGKPIEWWRTPAGKSAPHDPMPDEGSHATSHFATCATAERFRRAS